MGKTVKMKRTWRFPHANDWTILDLPITLLVTYQIAFTGLTIKADKEGFLIVLRGVRQGKQLVAFSGGRCYEDAIEVLCYEIAHDSLTWKADRYAS